MATFILILHVIVVVVLVGVILVQQGRGGGLIESVAGAESIFGTKTSSFLVRLTAILATLFFATSLTLAILSKREQRSVIEKVPVTQEQPAEDVSPENQGNQ